MANESWKVVPTSGDYEIDSQGKPVIDKGLLTPSYFRMKVPRTQWLYAPDANYGSDFYNFKRRHVATDFRIIEGIAEKALQPFLDDGRAVVVDAVTTFDSRNSTAIDVKITDAAGDTQQQTFEPIGR